jgi:hypothetical protein
MAQNVAGAGSCCFPIQNGLPGASPVSDSFDPYPQWLGISSEEQRRNHDRLLGIYLGKRYVRVLREGKCVLLP